MFIIIFWKLINSILLVWTGIKWFLSSENNKIVDFEELNKLKIKWVKPVK